ncbi:MAG: thioesterase family protein [Anaerolineales bacterium]|nr:thioesterase family protein [Anaerolineales bacterium]
MNLIEVVSPGDALEGVFLVEEANTARHVGSGGSRVLATPWMIAFMERVAHRLLAERLPKGYSSVGTLVHVEHLAPSPVGSRVRVRAEVTRLDGARVAFKIDAWDDVEQVGAGEHERFVIQVERFLQRVNRKIAPG